MNSRRQQTSIHRNFVLLILAVSFFILGISKLQAADNVTGATLLTESVSCSYGDLKWKIKIWQYPGQSVIGSGESETNLLKFLIKPNKKTFILIHGNLDKPNSFSLGMAKKIHALDQYNDFQILLVDWEDNASAATPEPGKGALELDNGDDVPMVVENVEKMFREAELYLSDITIIGHSFGAHIGGNLAWNARIGTVKHLVALDPASEKNDLGKRTSAATDWLTLRERGTYVESYMSSSNFGNVTYTYGNDNFG